jgi:ABC-type taurine transport system substrate-binding protein|tara:strand:+ start:12949 stop:13455 length:507 start_codon:yes stop_codon:yes gene_type:complete
MINIDIGGPHATAELNARKTLDGNVLIMDHDKIDIVVLPKGSKVVAFPKDIAMEDTYSIQSRFFEYLADKGVVERESVQGGSVFNSLEAVIPESKQANPLQAAVYVISEFLKEESELKRVVDSYEKELEDYYINPSDKDSTQLGEVPQEAEKGAMRPGYYYIPLRYRY